MPQPAWNPNNVARFTPRSGSAAGSLPAMPPRNWSGTHYSIVVLTEFVKLWVPLFNRVTPTLTVTLSNANVNDELAELTELIEYRPAVLTEAVRQRGDVTAYWQGALGYNQQSHPCTHHLAQAAIEVAQFVAMYHKAWFQRPRPSQVLASLMPPIAMPGHASYPSAHATEAYLLSAVLTPIVADPAGPIIPDGADVLQRLAERVSRNREVLGLHYPSDSVAGQQLAADTLSLFNACPSVVALTQAAKQEWQQFVTP